MLDVLAGGGARRTATIDRRVATIDSVGPQVLFRRLQEPRFVTGCAGSRRCSAWTSPTLMRAWSPSSG